MGTEKCQQCGGHAQAFAVMCGPRRPGSDDMKCTTSIQACEFCGGLGIVEVEAVKRYRRGLAFRERRVRKWRLTQRQVAQILKISPISLNDFEHGRTDLPASVDRRSLNGYEAG
jgi:hypothetical protein